MKKRANGQLVAFIGISRSGKSLAISEELKDQKKQVLVFDPKAEYIQYKKCETIAQLIEGAKAGISCSLVDCSKESLDQFCRIARNANRQKPCIVVVEELGGYTNQGKATGWWQRVVSQCLGEGMTIFATSQRASEIDKTTIGNATFMHICQQQTELDRKYIANNTTLTDEDIPRIPLEWVRWQSGKGKIGRGTFQFNDDYPFFVDENKKTKAKTNAKK
jgi:hypothetical protein